MADDIGEVINFFEFPNKYGLLKTIEQIKEVCHGMVMSDFIMAKAEYETNYSIEELLRE